MGCDIHLYREKHVDGRWVTADTWEPFDYGGGDKGQQVPYHSTYNGRNYKLFAILSEGVRGESPFSFKPRGMPLIASDEVRQACDVWCGDGHSHSYLYLHELKELSQFLATHAVRIEGMKKETELVALRESIASGSPDWNLLYPYCAGTNGEGYSDFEFDVPASFVVGECVDKIITLFDGCDGDNHRIVFWFDN